MRIGHSLSLGMLGLITICIGRVFGLMEMYVMGTAMILASICAVALTVSRVVLMDARRRLTTTAPQAGEDIGVELTLRAIRRTPPCELVDRIFDSSVGLGSRFELSVPAMRRGRTVVGRYRVHAENRGVLALGPIAVESGDPFGLCRRSRSLGVVDEVVVSPQWTRISLPDQERSEGDLVNALQQLARGLASELEFRATREYLPGDPMRFVNWRASARRDLLIVNEYESKSNILLDVFLDDSQANLSQSSFECAVSVAASFVGSIGDTADHDVRVRLSWGSSEDGTSFDEVIDSTTRQDAMRSLATISLKDRAPRPGAVRDRTMLSIPVLISGRPNLDWLERTSSALSNSPIVVVISCHTPTGFIVPENWMMVSVTNLDEFSAKWEALSRPRTRS